MDSVRHLRRRTVDGRRRAGKATARARATSGARCRAVRVRCAAAKLLRSSIYEYLTPLAWTFVLIPAPSIVLTATARSACRPTRRWRKVLQADFGEARQRFNRCSIAFRFIPSRMRRPPLAATTSARATADPRSRIATTRPLGSLERQAHRTQQARRGPRRPAPRTRRATRVVVAAGVAAAAAVGLGAAAGFVAAASAVVVVVVVGRGVRGHPRRSRSPRCRSRPPPRRRALPAPSSSSTSLVPLPLYFSTSTSAARYNPWLASQLAFCFTERSVQSAVGA